MKARGQEPKGFIPEGIFRKIHELMPIMCVDLCIVRDGRVLLLKRKKNPDAGRYWLPGGRLIKGESVHAAALRIARAETGMGVNVERFLGYTDLVFEEDPFGHGKKTHTVSLVFVCNPTSAEVVFDENHSSYLWWDGLQVFADIPSVVRNLIGKVLGGEA